MNHEEQERYELFQQLLENLEQEGELQDVSARDSKLQEEMAVMLEMAQALRAAAGPIPNPEPALARARARVLAAIPAQTAPARPKPAPVRGPAWQASWRHLWRQLGQSLGPRPVPAWATAVAVTLLLFVIMGVTTLRVSAHALPGDPLYPVKRLSERVILLTTFDPHERAELENQYQQRRKEETQQALQENRLVEVEFQGEITAMEGEYWRVDKFLVKIAFDRARFAQLPLGARVFIRGRTTPDNLIEVNYWRLVRLPPTPTFTPVPSPTPTALPVGFKLDSRATDTPAPPTYTPTRRPTRAPLMRPRRTATPTPTRTPTSTPTPTPTVTPTATLAVQIATGVITEIAPDRIVVAGTTYIRAATLDLSRIQVGDEVRVHYQTWANGQKVAIQVDLLRRPSEEPTAVAPPGRVSVSGLVQEYIAGQHIRVVGRRFAITEATTIIGRVFVGAFVNVVGHIANDGVTLVAERIEAKPLPEVAFDGIITAIEGQRLTIQGRLVDISQAQVQGQPEIGAFAQVVGWLQPDGVVLARTVAIAPPTNTPTSTPTLTLTPTPTPTSRPQATPTPTPVPPTPPPVFPTATPTSKPTKPAPTNTPVQPTSTPTTAPTQPPPTPAPTQPPPTNTPAPPTATPIPPTPPPILPTATPIPPTPTSTSVSS